MSLDLCIVDCGLGHHEYQSQSVKFSDYIETYPFVNLKNVLKYLYELSDQYNLYCPEIVDNRKYVRLRWATDNCNLTITINKETYIVYYVLNNDTTSGNCSKESIEAIFDSLSPFLERLQYYGI